METTKQLLWLGWLACCAQPWLGLAWACLACLALAWSSNKNRPPKAKAGVYKPNSGEPELTTGPFFELVNIN